MNEFEWRRQMRDLARPEPPRHDLWSQIAARIATGEDEAAAPVARPGLPASPGTAAPRTSRHARLLPWAMAASIAALSVLAAGLAHRLDARAPDAAGMVTTASRWQPKDPRLSGAAVELEAARMELAQAMRQAPDSPYLQRLMQRTQHQQSRLRRLEHEAG